MSEMSASQQQVNKTPNKKPSYSVISLKKGSSDLSTYTERSWKSISSDLMNDSGIGGLDYHNNSSSSFNSRNSSRKRKRPVPIINKQSTSTRSSDNQQQQQANNTIGDFSNQKIDDNRDEFYIENIESDDESKGPKRVGLCIQDGNRLIVKLNHGKKRRNQSTSDNLDQSSDRLNYYNSKNNSDYLNSSTTTTTGSVNKTTAIKSNLIYSPSSFKPNNNKGPPLSHSTPKVGSRVQKKLEQIENDFSPFKRKSNNPNDNRRRIDSPKTPLKTICQNVNKVDQKPFDTNKSRESSPEKGLSISQRISNPSSPEPTFKLKRPKIFKSADQSLRQFKVNSDHKKKRKKQNEKTPVILKNASTDCKTVAPYNGENVIREKNMQHNLNDNTNVNDKVNSVNLTPLKSQHISQTESPAKGCGPNVKESRNFLRMSKKMSKLIQKHNVAKQHKESRANKYPNAVNVDKPSVLSTLFETVYLESESRKNWLSMMKNDEVKRDSLFLKLTNVKASRNGFVDCDCIIDTDKMKEVFLFKYDKLKTLLPARFANDYEISSQAILEYLSPWSTYDCELLKTTFIINPFWIQIIDHGTPKSFKDDGYEVIYSNPNKDQFV